MGASNVFGYPQNKREVRFIKENRSRNHQIKCRLNDDEYDDFIRKVNKSKLSKEGFLRQLIRKGKFVEPPSIDYYNLVNELNPIGNNLNQIARKLNSNQEISSNAIIEIIKKLNLVLEKLDKQVRGL